MKVTVGQYNRALTKIDILYQHCSGGKNYSFTSTVILRYFTLQISIYACLFFILRYISDVKVSTVVKMSFNSTSYNIKMLQTC